MSPFRRGKDEAAAAEVEGIAARRPHAGMLRREQKVLLRAREAKLRDLGGLVVEMYRRGAFREALLEEACADAVGIDARRPHAGMLRREQKVLLRAREAKLRDLGG